MGILPATLLLALCWGDEIELTSGNVVEGRVQDLGDSIRVTRSGGSVTYPKSMVRRITPKKTAEELYEEKAAALKAGDLGGRLDLARWCLKNRLAKEAAAEYAKAVAIDPEHEEARLGAGFQKVDGRWMNEEEANTARGLVRHKGRWVSPEQRDLEEALEEQKELDQKLTQEVQAQLVRMRSPDAKRREDAAAALARIDDAYKLKAYLQSISHPARELRKFVFQELGRMKAPQALKPLVRRSLWDEDEALRPVAHAAVREIAHPDTALAFVPFLGEESISARMRTVEAIGEFRDLRAAPYLLAALENNLALQQMYDSQVREATALATGSVAVPGGGVVTLPRLRRIRYDPLDKESRAKLATERSLLVSALGALVGENHGTDLARWRAGIEKKNLKE
jgi:hypothetical protein